jgi:hypothetical protein
VGLAVSEVRGIVKRVFARDDVLEACARRDLGVIVAILGVHGVTQGQIAELTGIRQGRLSEWMQHKRAPRASSTFEAFADGLAVPAAARQALGLAPVSPAASGLGPGQSPGGRTAPVGETPPGTARPAPRSPAGPAASGLSGLQCSEMVRRQLDPVIAVLAAEQRRRNAGLEVRRRAWKNLVFTGGPGSGKSWTAIALGQTYKKLGVLSNGHVQQIAAADLAGAGPEETGKLVGEAFRQATGGILMINDAHAWNWLPARGDQVLRRLYENLNEYRELLNQEVAVILAGQAGPLRRMLHDNPPLAARFRAVVDFPGYTPGQLAVIVVALADEAGLRLTTAARSKAAAALARAEEGRSSRNARLAVGLVNQAIAAQARRVAAESTRGQNPGILNTITDTDIPDSLHLSTALPDDDWPGQYL